MSRWRRLATRADFARISCLVVLCAAALFLRSDTFGDPVANIDDQFYLLVGERMHHGMLPYVDIWDRKPPGIFAIYWLIAGISAEPAFYQLVATLFAAATAATITTIANRWTGRFAALLAGLLYLVMLGGFYGDSGQTAVFYNLPVAIAAWLLTKDPDSRRYDIAMLCLGLALTIKQTVAFEAVAMGLYAVTRLGIANAPRYVVIGLAPTLAFAALFFFCGHFAEYWQAAFVSIFDKSKPTYADVLGRGLDLASRLIPLLVLTAISFALEPRPPRFVALWICAAVIGVVSVPQLYLHYGIPLLLPLSVASASALDRKIIGPALALFAIAASMIYDRPLRFDAHSRSRAEIAAVVRTIRKLSGNSLLVFDGPSLLYTLTGRTPLSSLVFPPHLNEAAEIDVSGIATNPEIVRILAKRPAVIVLTEEPRNRPANVVGWSLVRQHIANHCRLAGSSVTHEMGSQILLIYACT